MSWVSENKFVTGFGAAMLVGVGTFGYLIYAGMDKYDTAVGEFDAASSNLKKLQETKPSLTDAHLKELLAQKKEMTEKIGAFQKELKSRVLPIVSSTPVAFQDKLKDTVAQVNARAAAANVERPKEFYLGFGDYQSKPPDDKAAPALARELRAIELVMGALIKTGGLELEEFRRDPLPEEGGAKRKSAMDRADHAAIERHGLTLKFTSGDEALRKVMTELANHKEQLFIIRNVTVQNKQMESPQRLGGPSAPAPDANATPAAPGTPENPAPAAPAAPGAPPATPPPAAPTAPTAPVAPALAGGDGGPLAYVFGTEKITSIIELEILNIEEKATSEKPEKAGKKKDK